MSAGAYFQDILGKRIRVLVVFCFFLTEHCLFLKTYKFAKCHVFKLAFLFWNFKHAISRKLFDELLPLLCSSLILPCESGVHVRKNFPSNNNNNKKKETRAGFWARSPVLSAGRVTGANPSSWVKPPLSWPKTTRFVRPCQVSIKNEEEDDTGVKPPSHIGVYKDNSVEWSVV
jgi:hypothetical protein